MSRSRFDDIRDKIIRHIENTLSYCEGMTQDDFDTNLMFQEACIFNVLQVGELAAKVIDLELDTEYPEIEWRQMRGMRNRIVHDYDGVHMDIVWNTIQCDFPKLLEQLSSI